MKQFYGCIIAVHWRGATDYLDVRIQRQHPARVVKQYWAAGDIALKLRVHANDVLYTVDDDDQIVAVDEF